MAEGTSVEIRPRAIENSCIDCPANEIAALRTGIETDHPLSDFAPAPSGHVIRHVKRLTQLLGQEGVAKLNLIDTCDNGPQEVTCLAGAYAATECGSQTLQVKGSLSHFLDSLAGSYREKNFNAQYYGYDGGTLNRIAARGLSFGATALRTINK